MINYTKGEWKIKYLPVTKQPAVYAGNEIIAGGITEDDAQLIASAPDLYEALKFLASYPSIMGYFNPEKQKEIREALAKAEGK